MSLAFWCLLVACLLPYVCVFLAKGSGVGKPLHEGGYDNRDPRAWLARQEGWAARANAAQANSFEALPFFIGAVLVAHQLHVPQARVDLLAGLFIACRLLYIAFYLGDRAFLRSLAWVIGLGLNIAIMLAAV